MKYNIRSAKIEDINAILEVVKDAKEKFKSIGIDQWSGDYPNEIDFTNDINNNQLYVCLDNELVIGFFVASFKLEEDYNNIIGKWLTDNKYIVMHRVAVKKEYYGMNISDLYFEYVKNMCKENNIKSIRIDTHEKNIVMLKKLNKLGFTRCGEVYLSGIRLGDNKRIGFELIVK